MQELSSLDEVASWDSESELWLEPSGQTLGLFEHSEPFSGSWPSSGMTRDGVAYVLPKWGHPTTDSVSSSSLPVVMLPTPVATDYANAPGPERTAAREQDYTRGVKLSEEVMRSGLLPTPQANLGANGGPQDPEKRKAGGHSVSLEDAATLLIPTPTASDFKGSTVERRQPGMHRGQLDAFVEGRAMLPTSSSGDRMREPSDAGSLF